MPHILIVDDDPAIRDSVRSLLEDEGYPVQVAHNGLDALEAIRSGALPRLILLDLMMPEMDGWEFRAEQQKDPRLAAIPVVVLSTVAHIREHAASLSVSEYLVKPVDAALLLNTVQRYC
jgi:CheY-like chemotaxis protein